MIYRTAQPEGWFLDALPLQSKYERAVFAQYALRSRNSNHYSDTFWLTNGEDWWVGIEEELDWAEFCISVDRGETPTLATFPRVLMPYYTTTYGYLLDYFMPEGIPWEDFGMQAVPVGWTTKKTHPRKLGFKDVPGGAAWKLPYERYGFEHWLRTHRKDLVRFFYGARSREVDYTIVTDADQILDTASRLSAHFEGKWLEYHTRWSHQVAEVVDPDVFQMLADCGVVLPGRHTARLESDSSVFLFLHLEFLPAVRAENGFAVIATIGGEPAALVSCRCTGSSQEFHTELVMRRTDPSYRRHALVPVLHAHAIQEACWNRGANILDMSNNWDPSIDGYKNAFGAVDVPLPGLRWTESRTLRLQRA